MDPASKEASEGDDLFERKQFEEARKKYQHAITLSANHPQVAGLPRSFGTCSVASLSII
jgi:hypothetical protein